MTIQKTKEWLEVAVPVPTEASFNVQLGCHLEEVVEMLECIQIADGTIGERILDDAVDALFNLAERLKKGESHAHLVHKVEFLDALADQIVTAVGCAHMANMDIAGALDEVNRSNFSKFEDGKPVFNEHGKIKKGRDYKAPELARFVGVGNEQE